MKRRKRHVTWLLPRAIGWIYSVPNVLKSSLDRRFAVLRTHSRKIFSFRRSWRILTRWAQWYIRERCTTSYIYMTLLLYIEFVKVLWMKKREMRRTGARAWRSEIPALFTLPERRWVRISSQYLIIFTITTKNRLTTFMSYVYSK